MFFILSKTINFLLQPLVIVCILFLAGFVIRKAGYKKKLQLTAFFLLLFFSNEFVAVEVMRLWELPVTPMNEIKKQYAYGILLTGVTKTMVVPRDRVYFARGADRATHTLQLHKMGAIGKIVVSGGSGRIFNREFKEADELAGFLRMAGVPPEDILIENKSDNTHESSLEVAKLMKGKAEAADCLLITSAYHLRRARACFAKAGLRLDTFATDPMTYPRTFSLDVLLIPKTDAMGIWQALFKEWAGMMAYKLAGYI